MSLAKVARNSEICNLYEEGYKQSHIAKKFGISKERVRQILNTLEVKIRKSKVPKTRSQFKKIIKLIEKGLLLKDLSDLFKVNVGHLSRILKKNGILISEIRKNRKCKCGNRPIKCSGMCLRCYKKYLYEKYKVQNRERRIAYSKKYRIKNREKIRQYDKEYHLKNIERFRQYDKDYRLKKEKDR